jgi:hypothetical protein
MFTSISAISDLLASKQGLFKRISVAWLESDLEVCLGGTKSAAII